VSCRKLGKQFECDHTTITRQLAKMNLTRLKHEKTQKYTLKQEEKAKKLSRKLVNQLYRENYSIIMDDEKYFTFSCNNMPGNDGYYTNDKQLCPDNVRFKGQEKFHTKILVWIAISGKGISEPLIRRVKSESINQVIYREECLKKRVLPFINEFHFRSDYIFWPDLAMSHYAKDNISWMEENINFGAKYLFHQTSYKQEQLRIFGVV